MSALVFHDGTELLFGPASVGIRLVKVTIEAEQALSVRAHVDPIPITRRSFGFEAIRNKFGFSFVR